MRSVSVLVGGALGAISRWVVGELLGSDTASFPWATLTVNVTGAFLLGAAGVVLIERLPGGEHVRALVLIGFLGAYTTFSTMALDGVLLIESGKVATALAYWLATLLVGQTAGLTGMWLGRARA